MSIEFVLQKIGEILNPPPLLLVSVPSFLLLFLACLGPLYSAPGRKRREVEEYKELILPPSYLLKEEEVGEAKKSFGGRESRFSEGGRAAQIQKLSCRCIN